MDLILDNLPLPVPANNKLVEVLGAHGVVVSIPPPVLGVVLLSLKDLARLFGCDYCTVKRWKRLGWIVPDPASSLSRPKFDPVQVVSVAARLFKCRKNRGFDRAEAVRLRLGELMDWIQGSVLETKQACPPTTWSAMTLMTLAALADCPDALPPAWRVSAKELTAMLAHAREQMRVRIMDPDGRQLLLTAYEQAGVLAAIKPISPNPQLN